jgi:hypothetical protein
MRTPGPKGVYLRQAEGLSAEIVVATSSWGSQKAVLAEVPYDAVLSNHDVHAPTGQLVHAAPNSDGSESLWPSRNPGSASNLPATHLRSWTITPSLRPAILALIRH